MYVSQFVPCDINTSKTLTVVNTLMGFDVYVVFTELRHTFGEYREYITLLDSMVCCQICGSVIKREPVGTM